jgi:hypothetical protein
VDIGAVCHFIQDFLHLLLGGCHTCGLHPKKWNAN